MKLGPFKNVVPVTIFWPEDFSHFFPRFLYCIFGGHRGSNQPEKIFRIWMNSCKRKNFRRERKREVYFIGMEWSVLRMQFPELSGTDLKSRMVQYVIENNAEAARLHNILECRLTLSLDGDMEHYEALSFLFGDDEGNWCIATGDDVLSIATLMQAIQGGW